MVRNPEDEVVEDEGGEGREDGGPKDIGSEVSTGRHTGDTDQGAIDGRAGKRQDGEALAVATEEEVEGGEVVAGGTMAAGKGFSLARGPSFKDVSKLPLPPEFRNLSRAWAPPMVLEDRINEQAGAESKNEDQIQAVSAPCGHCWVTGSLDKGDQCGGGDNQCWPCAKGIEELPKGPRLIGPCST